MSDEFESINSKVPNLDALLMQRIATQKGEASSLPAPGTFDPYQVLIKKKQNEDKPIDQSEIQKWPEADVKKLEEYCKKMGIIGFKSHLPPIVALGLLKKQLGDDYTTIPLEQRIPMGYEKIGTTSKYNSNYPYSEAIKKKQILHD